MSRQARGGADGFTLLELLIAVALMAFIALILAGGLRLGVRAWRGAQARSDEVARVIAVHDALERLIGRARAAYASDDIADLTLTFAGEADRLSLTAPLPDAIEPGIMAIQFLSIRRTERGPALTLAWRLDLPGAEARPEQVSVLLEDADSLGLQYWGAAQPGEAPAWWSSWRGQPRLPGLVRVDIGRDHAPPLAFIIAVPTNVSATCRYDPIGPTCRRVP